MAGQTQGSVAAADRGVGKFQLVLSLLENIGEEAGSSSRDGFLRESAVRLTVRAARLALLSCDGSAPVRLVLTSDANF